LLALAAGPAVSADQPTLKVGDPAPKLQTGKWIQGDPISRLEKGTTYIVEFWATWCGPCRASVPHLNEVHNKYKDRGLVVIGQNAFEPDDKVVDSFVKKMGQDMTYRVALDDKGTNDPQHGAMALAWMEAADQHGIPTAFVVDKQGRIAWIGHPMQLEDSVIEDILAGTQDIQKAAADYGARIKIKVQSEALFKQFSEALKKKNWDEALARLTQIEALYPDRKSNPQQDLIDSLIQIKQYDDAFKLAGQFNFPTLTLLPVDQAGTLRSEAGITPSTIVINNQTDHTLRELWITYDGKRQDYGTIPPHTVHTRLTWDTHPWLLVDEKGNPVALYVARAGGCIANIPPTRP
jgi:thiol-disulfide isomerase/thioredoxin